MWGVYFYAAMLGLVLAGVSHAEDVALEWIPPEEDCGTGAPLSSPIDQYRVMWVRQPAVVPDFTHTGCVCDPLQYTYTFDGTVLVQAPAIGHTLSLLPGLYYFAVTAISQQGGESCTSNILSRVVEGDPAKPNSPVDFQIISLLFPFR